MDLLDQKKIEETLIRIEHMGQVLDSQFSLIKKLLLALIVISILSLFV